MAVLFKRGLLSITLISVFFAASCTKEPMAPFRVGTNVWPGYEPFYIAHELGFYGDTEVRMVEYPSATEVIRAFRNGSIEAAAVTLDEALLLAQHGSDFRIILVLDYSNGADSLVAGEGLTRLRDLRGKRVGAEVCALGAYVLARALDKAGLSLSEITLVPLSIDEHEKAFLNRSVDAVVTFEPVRSRLLSKGGRVLFGSSDMPGEIIDVLIVRAGCLERDRARVDGLLKGWFKGVEYVSKSPGSAVQKMKARLKLGEREIKKTMELIYFPPRYENLVMLGSSLPESASMLEGVMLENRLISAGVDIRPLIDERPLKELE